MENWFECIRREMACLAKHDMEKIIGEIDKEKIYYAKRNEYINSENFSNVRQKIIKFCAGDKTLEEKIYSVIYEFSSDFLVNNFTNELIKENVYKKMLEIIDVDKKFVDEIVDELILH